MIARYSVPEIAKIWTDDHKYQVWADVELLITEAWAQLGIVPQTDLEKIKSTIKVDLTRMGEIEAETKHDVVAFTRMLSEQLGPEARWIHLGITSTDIVDTAQNYLIKQSSEVFLPMVANLQKVLMKLALENKDTLIMGRTHGIAGEPTSLGLKFLLWHEELNRQVKRLNEAFDDVCVAKVSGSMGNYAHVDPEVEAYVAEKLGMKIDRISTQVSQRDRLGAMFSVLANYASTLEKMATEIRLYQQSEISELMEGFGTGQKGSSSMPHKKNPISSENITGLSRLIRSAVIPGFENNVLWHERDISHSSNERILIPDTLDLATYITKRMTNVLENLYINNDQMLANINRANDIFYTQPLLTQILKEKDFTREEVYDFIQKAANETLTEGKPFKEVLIANGIDKYLSTKELDDIFTPTIFLKNVDKIYQRLTA